MSLLPDWLTGYDSDNADAAAAADAESRRINALNRDRGRLSEAAYEQTQRDFQTQEPIGQAAQRAAIDKAFTDELADRAKGIFKTPLDVAWETILAILKAVPWFVWLGAAVAIFLWLGWGKWLLRKLSHK
jgi:hypothetical protein